MNLFLCLCLLIAFTPLGTGNFFQEHQTKDLPSFKHKTTLQDIEQKLHNVAVEYRPQYGQLPRIVLFDVAYPSSPEEDEALNRHAVILITVVTQEARELPIKRVYVRSANGNQVDLKVLGSYYAGTSEDFMVRDTLGPYRAEIICLIPITSVFSDSTLQLDFAKNRTEFVVKKFPLSPPEEFLLQDKERNPDTKKSVSTTSIGTILLREFPDFKNEKFAVEPPPSEEK